MQGVILKGIAGFYYVDVEGFGLYECKAKGIFRKHHQSPMVGDHVIIEEIDEAFQKGTIAKILERKNQLKRPVVANVDHALVIFAIKDPEPAFLLIDRFLIGMKENNVPCTICFNKKDLASDEEIKRLSEMYKNSGSDVLFTSSYTKEGIADLKEVIRNKTVCVAGPSGVGKSSLINELQMEVCMEVGDLSRKTSRGKHTTRHAQLIPIMEHSYIVDTPGFSSFEPDCSEAGNVQDYYDEFDEYRGLCRFNGCSHLHEPDCEVKKAVELGQISQVRYDNYCSIYKTIDSKRRY